MRQCDRSRFRNTATTSYCVHLKQLVLLTPWLTPCRPLPRGADRYLLSLIKAAMPGQDFRLGIVHPHSQFLSVPMHTPSCAATAFRESPNRKRSSNNDLPNSFVAHSPGCGSALMALITKWQNGFKNLHFRHLFAILLQDGGLAEAYRISSFALVILTVMTSISSRFSDGCKV
jgi:hypothetical protein